MPSSTSSPDVEKVRHNDNTAQQTTSNKKKKPFLGSFYLLTHSEAQLDSLHKPNWTQVLSLQGFRNADLFRAAFMEFTGNLF